MKCNFSMLEYVLHKIYAHQLLFFCCPKTRGKYGPSLGGLDKTAQRGESDASATQHHEATHAMNKLARREGEPSEEWGV